MVSGSQSSLLLGEAMINREFRNHGLVEKEQTHAGQWLLDAKGRRVITIGEQTVCSNSELVR